MVYYQTAKVYHQEHQFLSCGKATPGHILGSANRLSTKV
jgi:hypothetical protein